MTCTPFFTEYVFVRLAIDNQVIFRGPSGVVSIIVHMFLVKSFLIFKVSIIEIKYSHKVWNHTLQLIIFFSVL